MRFKYNLKPHMILIRLALCSSLIFLFACKDETTYKIGVSQCSQDDWRNKMNEEIKREIMYHEDAIVEIRSADDNRAKHLEDIR